jgi:hypothetical protein
VDKEEPHGPGYDEENVTATQDMFLTTCEQDELTSPFAAVSADQHSITNTLRDDVIKRGTVLYRR